MVLFGLLGLVVGAAAALVLDRIDSRLHTKEDAERITGLPVLAEIPHLPRRYRSEIITVTRPSSPFAEAYRSLRTTLAFARPVTEQLEANGSSAGRHRLPGDERRVILVTSPGPQEGKTTTVAHLAASYAEAGKSVLVLDCDFRRPRLHRIFGTHESPGLADTLDDPTKFASDNEVISTTSVDGVRLVPAGAPTTNPARLFNRARVLIDASRRQADIVLVDTPPLLIANDASELIRHVDSVALVLRNRRTSRHNAVAVAEQLERQQAPVVGIVMVGTDEATSGYGGYYYYRANARPNEARRRRRLWPFGRRKMSSVDGPAEDGHNEARRRRRRWPFGRRKRSSVDGPAEDGTRREHEAATPVGTADAAPVGNGAVAPSNGSEAADAVHGEVQNPTP
jgi:capsular exopolysaccharide synthesis family protein